MCEDNQTLEEAPTSHLDDCIAGTGKLVLVGLNATDHTPAKRNGHVVVVISGILYRTKYPLVGEAGPAAPKARARSRWAKCGI